MKPFLQQIHLQSSAAHQLSPRRTQREHQCKMMGGKELADAGMKPLAEASGRGDLDAGRSRHQVEHSTELYLRHYAITVHDQMVRGKAHVVFQGTLS